MVTDYTCIYLGLCICQMQSAVLNYREPAKRVKLDSSATGAGGSGDQTTPTMVTPTAAPPTSVAATTQPTDAQQQWAAAYQQQWGAYPYGQPVSVAVL